jgi:enolase
MNIADIKALEILDSRGEPTIEVELVSDNISAVFGVPAGASTGKKEARELRDGGERYNGKGVEKAIGKLESIRPKLLGMELFDQQKFDELLIELDGTTDKSNLGANTIVGLSIAYTMLCAKVQKQPLWQYIAHNYSTSPEFPRIYANLVNGGKHAPGLDIQEFMIVPKNNDIQDSIQKITEFRNNLKQELSKSFGAGAELVGDEGGFAPTGATAEQILGIYKNINNSMNNYFEFALDSAASSFYKNNNYVYEKNNLSSQQLLDMYNKYSNDYGMLSIEDPFAEDDLEAWKDLSKTSHSFFVVGDDLTVTNAELTDKYAEESLIDGVIIKPNQIGTMTETMQTISSAQKNNIKVIVSHRSGETTSSFISDLAYAIGAFGIKVGAPVRGERVAKYDRLLEISKEVK